MKTKKKVFLLIITFFSLLDFSETKPKFNSYENATTWYESQKMEIMIPDSTSIYMAKYHKLHKVLIVYFIRKKAKGYIHGDFPETLWEQFKRASSKGRFYIYFIKGRYPYPLD